MKRVLTGLERLTKTHGKLVEGRRVGLVAHPASVTAGLVHALDVLVEAGAMVEILFGPEHGFAGEAQDMEPVGGASRHGPRGIPLHSLYGEEESTLSPPADLLAGLDALVVDLFDVGARYYTFAWTAVLCLRACHGTGVEMLLLDRPNPLGDAVEGAPQWPDLLSFVGLVPVSNRHGLSLGELVGLTARAEGTSDALSVIPALGWDRGSPFPATGLPWVLPSPNMPSFDTAAVYPGMCLLEATWCSEGRGTTRPFELFGAPGIDGASLARRLDAMDLPGARFRPAVFKPTFQKHAGVACGGAQIHVTDLAAFRPYLSGVAVLLALRAEAGERFSWREQPYEFVSDRPAIDLLAGSTAVREGIERGAPLSEIAASWESGQREFERTKREFHLY